MLTATVSGSFHRHMGEITRAVNELASLSVRVLSPADPRVVGQQGEFLFVASDPIESVRLVQDRHLECIRAASFLWLVCPDGYVGQSASMEIGFAAGASVPIFSTCEPADLTLREYVQIANSIEDAVRAVEIRPRTRQIEGLLIDPHASIETAQKILEQMNARFLRQTTGTDPSQEIYGEVLRVRAIMSLPGLVQ
jgi:hypothetical protein